MGCDIHWFVEEKIANTWEYDPNAPEFNDRIFPPRKPLALAMGVSGGCKNTHFMFSFQ